MNEHMTMDVDCSPVNLSMDGTWDDIQGAFGGAQPIPFMQAWRSEPEEGFVPAEVRVGWDQRVLWVYARLTDRDAFNPVTKFNEPAFPKGDVFEVFLRPLDQEAYYELHVTPQNHKFQLRIPSEQAFQEGRKEAGSHTSWLVQHPVIESRVRVDVAKQMWSVLAAVPLSMVAEKRAVEPGDVWLFSFSRYDYTRGEPKPVLSSTSPHAEINFHRQQDWRRLSFC